MSTETKDYGMGPVTPKPGVEYTKDPMSPSELGQNGILVVGTNFEGQHGGGAARFASEVLGLKMGVGEGISGKAYALPTLSFGMTKHLIEKKGSPLLTYDALLKSFRNFVETAKANPDKKFYMTKVGLGIAGYPLETIHKAFWESGAPFELENLVYPIELELPDDAVKSW